MIKSAVIIDGAKLCTKCKIVKPIECFHKTKRRIRKDGTRKVGLYSWCKDCKKSKNRELYPTWYKNNNKKVKSEKYQWKKDNHDKVLVMQRNNKKKAIDEIKDRYAIYLLMNNTKLSIQEIRQYPELIESQRLLLKTKRLCKTLQS